MSKRFLTVERNATYASPRQTVNIPKGSMVELVCVNSTHQGAMIRVKTLSGDVADLEPRVFNQDQVQPLLRDAFSRR